MKTRFLILVSACLMWAGLAFAQININTASQEQLDGLKGVGPAKARAIIEYRKKNGAFKSVDDLQNVPGIGPATLNDLRGDIAISGTSRPSAAAPAKPSADKPKSSAAPARPAAASALAPAKPAMPGKVMVDSKPAAGVAPALEKPAAPARPAMPGKSAEMVKPAVPAPMVKPATPMIRPATPAIPAAAAKPAAPAAPAAPARPPVPAKPAGY